jgi:class 3 adenylate cyclase
MSANYKIMVVDDEDDVEMLVRQKLRRQVREGEYELLFAKDGVEAMALLQAHPGTDIVFTDINMPRMDGLTLLGKIFETLPLLKAVVISAYSDMENIRTAMNRGAFDFITKPFDFEDFETTLLKTLKAVGQMRYIHQLEQDKLNQERAANEQLRRVHEATSKFVPNEFLLSLGKSDITEVALGNHAQRQVTVLFSDIRDYTGLAEGMTPHENFNFVNAFHGRMGPLIRQHSGFVNQYLGDGIMAIFPENPADALRAAIAMQHATADYNESRLRKGRQPIRVGMGMYAGDLIMGIIGDQHRLDAATISDTVNVASRLESLSKYFGANILLSHSCLDKMGDAGGFHVRYLGKVQVKGKYKAVRVFECFDGDAPAVFEMKLATIAAFGEGMDCYFKQDFAGAAAAFGAVLQHNPGDLTAQLFLKKATHFLETAPPENWTGVEMMMEK